MAKTIKDILDSIGNKHLELVTSFKEKEKNEENSKEFEVQWLKILEDELPFKQEKVKAKICSHLKSKAKEFSDSVEYISEFNQFDFDSYHTEPDTKLKALLKLGTNPENWRIYGISENVEHNCLEVMFGNKAVNSGNELFGHALVNVKGALKHHFTVFNNN